MDSVILYSICHCPTPLIPCPHWGVTGIFLHLKGQCCGFCHLGKQPTTFPTVLFFEVVLNRSSTSVMITTSKGGPGSTRQWFSVMQESWMLSVPNWLYYTSFLHKPNLHNWILKHLCAKESCCKRPLELSFCLASLLSLSLSFLNLWNQLWMRVPFPKPLFGGAGSGIPLLVPLISLFCLPVIFPLHKLLSILAFSTHLLNKKKAVVFFPLLRTQISCLVNHLSADFLSQHFFGYLSPHSPFMRLYVSFQAWNKYMHFQEIYFTHQWDRYSHWG